MAQVRANVTCFVDNVLRQEGDVFEYNGPKSSVFSPLEGESEVQTVEDAVVQTPTVKKKWTPKAKQVGSTSS